MRSDFFDDEFRRLSQFAAWHDIVRRTIEIESRLRLLAGDQRDAIAAVLDERANALMQMGETEQAIAVIQMILSIDKDLHGESSEDFVRNLCNLGALYVRMSRWPEADLVLNQAIELARQLPIRWHLELAKSLKHLAQVREHTGDLNQSLQLLLKSASVVVHSTGSWHKQMVFIYFAISRILWKQNQPAAALRAIRKATRLSELGDRSSHELLFRCRFTMAQIQQATGDHHGCKNSFSEALHAFDRCVPDTDPRFALVKSFEVNTLPPPFVNLFGAIHPQGDQAEGT